MSGVGTLVNPIPLLVTHTHNRMAVKLRVGKRSKATKELERVKEVKEEKLRGSQTEDSASGTSDSGVRKYREYKCED